MAENDAKKKDGPPPREAAAAATEKAEAKTPAAPKAGKPSPLVAAAMLAGMVIGSSSAAVVVASLLLRSAPAPVVEKAAKTAEKPEKPVEFTMEQPVIVNVFQTQERRYLSAKPVFVLTGADLLEKVKAKQAELQHILIGLLKGKTLDQLDDPDATNVLGREIQETANAKLNLDQGITRVYFTQFVVQ